MGAPDAIATGDPGDPAGVVAEQAGHGDAELDARASRRGGVNQHRVEHSSPRRIQRLDAMRRLDGDRHAVGARVVSAIVESGLAYGWSAGVDDAVEQAPLGQQVHAAAHERMGGEGV